MKLDDPVQTPVEAHTSPLNAPLQTGQSAAIDVVRKASGIDWLLWVIALLLLIGSTLIGPYLTSHWAPASSIWVRLAIIIGMIVTALGLIYSTHQGRGFMRLLQDSKVELRRISWPARTETFQTTWIVLIIVLIMSLLMWGIDSLFGWLISSIIG